PNTWHPIGPASSVPVVDDVFAAFVPPDPGTYLLRLAVTDRAGSYRARTRVVTWDLRPALANLTQTELLISPNGDGVKDAVTFNYLVQEPTRMDVRVESAAGTVVRRLSFESPDLGPASFVWDGRDEGGQVVRDGRYTVFLNELPLRVEVDSTPPDIAYSLN